MTSDRTSFIESLKAYSREGLVELAVSLHEKLLEYETLQAENARINTESYLEYQKVCSERDSLKKEVSRLEETLQKIADSNAVMNKAIYGSRTEKFFSSLPAEPDVLEDEAQEEDPGTESSQRIIDPEVFQKALTENAGREKKSVRAGKTAACGRTGSRGKSAGQTDPLRESADRLPKDICYDIDVEALDRKYGKGNWRIAFWQETKTVEKLPVAYYQKIVYTPVISSGLEHKLQTQDRPERLLPWSLVSPSMMADICTRKFFLSLPTARQEKDYRRQGLMLSKQDMIHWMNRLVPRVLGPVCEYLFLLLLKRKYNQTDETYIQVNRDGRSASTKSFLWVHCSAELAEGPPIIIFCFERTRGTDHLRKYYMEFIGYIICDAYIAYQILEKEHPDRITVSGCMMHARRYFAVAFFVRDLEAMTDEEIMELPETKVLLKIRSIYAEEDRLKGLTAEDRLKKRQERIAPKMDDLFAYIHELDKSGEAFPERLQRAITYAVNQEQRLRVFLTDGNIPIDNGHAERVIASYSVGRANCKFADTIKGAEVTATMYSLVETAKANGADVEIYLRYLFEKVPAHLNDDGTLKDRAFLPEMTPWSDVYRSYEMMEKQRGLKLCREMFREPERPKTPKKEKQPA